MRTFLSPYRWLPIVVLAALTGVAPDLAQAICTTTTTPSTTTTTLPSGCNTNVFTVLPSTVGSDLGAKINTVVGAANATHCGGIVDARGFTGSQSAAAPIYLGIDPTRTAAMPPITLLLGPVRFKMSGAYGIVLGLESSVVGVPVGALTDTAPIGQGYTSLVAGDHVTLDAVIQVGSASVLHLGDRAAIRDVLVDGNRANGAMTNGIRLYHSERVDVQNVSVANSSGHGIEANGATVGCSCYSNGDAGVPRFRNLLIFNNGGDGIHLEYVNDAYLAEVEVETNTGAGISLLQSGAARITHGDISSNQYGINASESSLLNVTTTQFNGNHLADVASFHSTSCAIPNDENIVANNAFTGNGANLAGNVPMVYFQEAQNCSISGNNFFLTSSGGFTNYAGVQFDGLSASTNVVVGNTFFGAQPGSTGHCYVLNNGCQTGSGITDILNKWR
jgi:hypothetical protein